jgi:hypothetical protein
MYSSSELVSLGQHYCDATGASASALSVRVTGQTKLFAQLLAGRDCTMRSAEFASVWMDLNWPAPVPWPADVRPRGTALAVLGRIPDIVARLDRLTIVVEQLIGKPEQAERYQVRPKPRREAAVAAQ